MKSIQLIGIDYDDFKNEVAEEVRKAVDQTKPQPEPLEIYHTRKETAERLRVDLSTLAAWTKKGLIQSVGIGGRVYFTETAIQKAITDL